MGNNIGSAHKNKPANARTLREAMGNQKRILSEVAELFDNRVLGGSFSWPKAARVALVHHTQGMAASGVRKYRSALARYMRDGGAYSEDAVYAVCGPISEDEREQVARDYYAEGAADAARARFLGAFADHAEERDESEASK